MTKRTLMTPIEYMKVCEDIQNNKRFIDAAADGFSRLRPAPATDTERAYLALYVGTEYSPAGAAEHLLSNL